MVKSRCTVLKITGERKRKKMQEETEGKGKERIEGSEEGSALLHLAYRNIKIWMPSQTFFFLLPLRCRRVARVPPGVIWRVWRACRCLRFKWLARWTTSALSVHGVTFTRSRRVKHHLWYTINPHVSLWLLLILIHASSELTSPPLGLHVMENKMADRGGQRLISLTWTV